MMAFPAREAVGQSAGSGTSRLRAFLDRLFATLLRIRYRLLLVNVLAVAVPLVGISFARFYEREMLRALEDDMVNQAALLKHALQADPLGLRLAERGPMLVAAARLTRTRIRLLDNKGQVLADSHQGGPPEGPEEEPGKLLGLVGKGPHVHVGPPNAVDLAERTEIKRALRGEYSSATRAWQKGDRVFLFSALPLTKQGRVEGVVYVTRSTNPVRTAMHRIKKTLLIVLIAALSATVILSLFLAATISRPLSRLTRIAERIAAGDRGQALALTRRDEIGQLARAFDAMTRKLDERARYIAELAANISHEFKSPLTSIRGAAELLIDGAADDPAARARFLNNILTDARRLDRLVTRLLELSRFEADPAPTEVLDYEALAREAVERSSAQGPAKVVLEYRAAATHLLGRRAHLLSAISNLLDNAQQHAAPDTTITVHVGDGPGGVVRTSVHNRGPVISEANLTKIWDRFFTTRADRGGTGLGLPIVTTVVTAHGGTVSVTSTAEEGTTFSFDLPRRA